MLIMELGMPVGVLKAGNNLSAMNIAFFLNILKWKETEKIYLFIWL